MIARIDAVQAVGQMLGLKALNWRSGPLDGRTWVVGWVGVHEGSVEERTAAIEEWSAAFGLSPRVNTYGMLEFERVTGDVQMTVRTIVDRQAFWQSAAA